MCRSKAAGGRRCPGHRPVPAPAGLFALDEQPGSVLMDSGARRRPTATEPVLEQNTQASRGGVKLPPMDTARYGQIARDERTAAILQDLHTAVDQVARSGQVERWLDALATDGMRRWSANNRLIALLQLQERAQAQQRPELLEDVHMMSLRQWDSEHGRRVKKGEKAIWILAPRTRKLEEQADDGTRTTRTIVTGFSAVPVFNITQTEGPDLPAPPVRTATGTVRPGVLQGLRERVGAAGYTYQEQEIDGTNPEKGTGTLGYTDPSTRTIVVDARLADHQKATTIAHELGHVHAGHVDSSPQEYHRHRGQMETEAEAAAYITCRKLGIDRESSAAFSPGYIAGWMSQKGADFQTALTKAVRAADTILDGHWPDDDSTGGNR